MAALLREITHDEVTALVAGDMPFVLVDALAPLSYAAAHLPGAVNIPLDRVDAIAPRRIPTPDTLVVVYCAGPACTSSVDVATRLIELGYRDVAHYVGGKEEWVAADLPLEASGSQSG